MTVLTTNKTLGQVLRQIGGANTPAGDAVYNTICEAWRTYDGSPSKLEHTLLTEAREIRQWADYFIAQIETKGL